MVALFICSCIFHEQQDQDFVSIIESMQDYQYILRKKNGINKIVHQQYLVYIDRSFVGKHNAN